MVSGFFWGIGAGVMAIAAGGFLADGLSRSVKRKQAVLSMLSDGWSSRLKIVLTRGIRPLAGASRKLLEIDAVRASALRAQMMLEENGFGSKKVALVSLLLGAVITACLVTMFVSSSLVFGLASGCIVAIGIVGHIKSRSDRTTAEMREGIPEVIRCMQTCFRSGQSLLQTLRYTSSEVGGSLGKIFSIAADRLDVGDTTADALSVLRQYPDVPELSFVAVALDVQHQTGGSIIPVLESARESVEGELDLMRTLRVQTAQAKLSATIVTVMPFVLIALFSLMSPDFLSPFFESWQGLFLFALALIMQVAGVVSVRRMLRIDVS